jgi:hypothetical protein
MNQLEASEAPEAARAAIPAVLRAIANSPHKGT